MNCEELMDMVEDGAQVIDVRTPHEYNNSHIRGAVNIPIESAANIMTMYKKDTKLLLYCRIGERSGAVADFLSDSGYDVLNIGGIFPFAPCLEAQ